MAITKISAITAARLAKTASTICSLTTTILLNSLNGTGTSSSILDKLEYSLALFAKDISKL